MSRKWSKEIRRFAGLKGYKRGLLLELADMANAGGYCWAKHATMADRLGCSKKTIERCGQFLEDGGYIQREIRRNPDGSPSSTGYFLRTFDEAVEHQKAALAAEAEHAATGPTDDTPGPGRPAEQLHGRQAAAANTSARQHVNTSTRHAAHRHAAERRQVVTAADAPDLAQRLKALGHEVADAASDDPPARRAAG